MGAIVAALVAQDRQIDEIQRLAKTVANFKPTQSYDFPAVAVNNDKNINKIFSILYGDQHRENLWLPYFCVTCDLTLNQVVVKISGSLTKWVKASSAVPGLLPPVIDNDHVYVDGGVLNNLPVDIMEEIGANYVIAVNVSRNKKVYSNANYPTTISGWNILLNKMIKRNDVKIPNITDVILRSFLASTNKHTIELGELADICIVPPVENFDLINYDAADELIEIGYAYTSKLIEGSDLFAKLNL